MAGGAASTTSYTTSGAKNGQKYLFPFILVTSLFFMWGLSYGLLDVLNVHFQNTLSIDKARSMLLQGAYFGAYFLMALPAGLLMKRYGYKFGIIFGLLLFATGAALFYPSAHFANFNFFLLSLVGLLLRAWPLVTIPFFHYKNVLHAHSHFAFGGWVMPILFALLIKYFPELVRRIAYYHLKNIAGLLCSCGIAF